MGAQFSEHVKHIWQVVHSASSFGVVSVHFHEIRKSLVHAGIPFQADPHPSCPSQRPGMGLFRGCVLSPLVSASPRGTPCWAGNRSQPIPFLKKKTRQILWRILGFNSRKPPRGSREQQGAEENRGNISSAFLCIGVFLTFTG